jgi:molybdopterin biosynthesis enzyme
MLTGSGLLSTLTKANAILVIPEDVEGYDEGEEVEVELLEKPVRGGTEKWQSYTTGLSH